MRLLTKLREDAELTRFGLGAKSGVHPARVGQIESGRVVPYPPELRRIAEALQWPVDRAQELLQGTNDE